MPFFEVTDKRTPVQIANLIRKSWKVPLGPIENLEPVTGRQGILISSFDFGTDRVDSRSMLTDDNQPIIFLEP